MPQDDARGRWNRRYQGGDVTQEPDPFVVAQATRLPRTGCALDVAGGAGRHAIWLARRGLDVTLIDVSDEACALATKRADTAGVAVAVVRTDLDVDPLPPGRWDVVLVVRYLDREVIAAAPDLLAPGGLFVFTQPTLRNLERHDRPERPWLLEPGELAGLVRGLRDVEVVELTEGWTPEGRHEARVVLRAAFRDGDVA